MNRTALTLLLSLWMASAHAATPAPPAALGFVENLGQFDQRVAYQLAHPGHDVYATRDGEIVHRFHGGAATDWVLVERWSAGGKPWRADGNAATTIALISAGGTRHGGVYAQVRRENVWPGVDAQLRVQRDGVETQFNIAPGADVGAIAVALSGAEQMNLLADGSLRIATGIGGIELSAPVAWQVIDGDRVDVGVAYDLRGDVGYGFRVSDHDARHALHIDPVIRSTFVGGDNDEFVEDLIVADDSVYVTGTTKSANFPGTTGGAQPAMIRNSTLGGNSFVARYSRDLTQLLQATYLGIHGPFNSGGQSSGPSTLALAVTADSLYVTGVASAGSMPAGQTSGAQTSAGSDFDAFVARFNRGLTVLRATSYHGGDANDFGNAIAVDANSVYIAGYTSSTNLPDIAGAAVGSIVNPPNGDAFVARFSLDLGTRQRSTYLSGAGNNGAMARDMLLDADSVYIVGESAGGLIATSGAFQPDRGSVGFSKDAFIARYSADLGTLHRASYIGGSGNDGAREAAANATALYVAGDTVSGAFPIAPDAPDTTAVGGDSFLFAISRDLSARVGATLFGGSGSENVGGLAANDTAVFIGGTTNSNNLPASAGGAEPANPNSSIVGFVARLNTGLSQIAQSTYYFGSVPGKQVFTLGAFGSDVYVAGRVGSGSPLPMGAGSAQPMHGGSGFDGFIGLLSGDLQAPQPISNLAITKTGSPDREFNRYLIYTITVRNLGPDVATGARVLDLLPASIGAANWACVASGGATCTANGAGSIDTLVNLPLNGVTTFTLCALHVGDGANVVNTASVDVPLGRIDSDSSNNSATHSVIDPSLFKDGFEEGTPPPLCAGLQRSQSTAVASISTSSPG